MLLVYTPYARSMRAILSGTCLLALSLGLAPAAAQQSASPNLLPPVEIAPPRLVATPAQPAQRPTTRTRRATRMPVQQAATPSSFPPVVISPTGIATPIDRVASSVSVVTQKDIATQQYRSVPDVLATIPGLNIVQTGGPAARPRSSCAAPMPITPKS